MLCDQGASAKYVKKENGVWGARSSNTAIHCALKHQNIEMTQFLLERGAQAGALLEDYDWRGCGSSRTAFERASKLGEDYVLLFLKHGADPNLESRSDTHSMRTDGSSSWRLLHRAVEQGSETLVDALLKAGADITLRQTEKYDNERGYNRDNSHNALHIACRRNHLAIAARLLDEAARRGLNDFVDATCTHTVHKERNPGAPPPEFDDPRREGYVSPVICVQVRPRQPTTGSIRVHPFPSTRDQAV